MFTTIQHGRMFTVAARYGACLRHGARRRVGKRCSSSSHGSPKARIMSTHLRGDELLRQNRPQPDVRQPSLFTFLNLSTTPGGQGMGDVHGPR